MEYRVYEIKNNRLHAPSVLFDSVSAARAFAVRAYTTPFIVSVARTSAQMELNSMARSAVLYDKPLVNVGSLYDKLFPDEFVGGLVGTRV